MLFFLARVLSISIKVTKHCKDQNKKRIQILKNFENPSVEKKMLSTALGFEPRSFDCRSMDHDNWLKNKKLFKVKKFQKNAQKNNIFSLKVHKGDGILENPKTFLNKGAKHKKNYMEDLNSKNKNIKGSGFP